jgi:hypothetical protein
MNIDTGEIIKEALQDEPTQQTEEAQQAKPMQQDEPAQQEVVRAVPEKAAIGRPVTSLDTLGMAREALRELKAGPQNDDTKAEQQLCRDAIQTYLRIQRNIRKNKQQGIRTKLARAIKANQQDDQRASHRQAKRRRKKAKRAKAEKTKQESENELEKA